VRRADHDAVRPRSDAPAGDELLEGPFSVLVRPPDGTSSR
jgi:hypothetical protein